MKTMKRMFAFALVAVMALAMTVTAFADEKKTYSITVENAVAGHTYEAYQIFAGDLSEDGAKISNIKWGSGISAEGQAALGDAVAYAKNLEGVVSNSSEATKTAETFNQYLAAPAGTVSVPADSANVSYKITGLDAGYYLIKDKDGSLDGTEDSYTEFILKVVKDQTVQPKADTTVVEKKVKDINDLSKIGTLGFRGEALSSIASVSRVTLSSKTEDDIGYQTKCEGGVLDEIKPIGATQGTYIIVEDLFYNIPARKKFLRKPKIEENDITNYIARLILANPDISFKYIADNKLIYQSFGSGLYDAIYTIYGKTIVDNIFNLLSSTLFSS